MSTLSTPSCRQVTTAPTPAHFTLSSDEVNPLFKALFLKDFRTVLRLARGISGRAHTGLMDELGYQLSQTHNTASLEIRADEAGRLLEDRKKAWERMLTDDRYREARAKAGLEEKTARIIQTLFLDKKNRKTLFSILEKWSRLDFFGPGKISSLVRNVILARSCETFALFNEKIRQVRSGDHLRGVDPETLEAQIEDLEKTFTAQYSEYQSLVRSGDADSLSQHCHLIRSELEVMAGEVADLAVASYFVKESDLKSSRKADRQRACLLHLSASRMVREYLFANGASYYFSRLAAQGPETKAWNNHQKVAQKTAFASLVPNGRNQTIETFSSLPPDDSKLYEFWGQVTQLRSFREGPTKVVSMFTLQSLHDASEMEVSVAYRNLQTRGLQAGCLVNVNGTVYVSREGPPRLRLDRLSLARNGRESWMDYLRNLFSPYFRFYTCNCNLVYSLEPADPAPQPSFMSEILFNYRD